MSSLKFKNMINNRPLIERSILKVSYQYIANSSSYDYEQQMKYHISNLHHIFFPFKNMG
jgi:hypothetical protein